MNPFDLPFACPRCGIGLIGMSCKACHVTFPVHDGVPWLFADPDAAVSEWKNRWRLALEHLRADLRRTEAALATVDRTRTRRRLEVLAAGYRKQHVSLEEILAPLALAQGGSLETLLALRTRLPGAHGILSYEANVHRDWCWGEQECAMALGSVIAALGDQAVQRILILGAGAGRLAYDLHQQTSTLVTVAVDLNPLLTYVGARVSAGGRIELVEFPLAPRSPESAAIIRTLTAPTPTRPGLEFVLADALRPPFTPGSFDLVVTPWLLDVIPTDTIDILRNINVLLEEGGVWINQGSVAFDAPDPSARYTLPELLDLAGECGFSHVSADERQVPYMECPDSRHGRREIVATMRARKATPVEAVPRLDSLPNWIVEGRSPIPALPAFQSQAMTTRMHAFIMTLIDGQRSLKDIARVLEEQKLMSRQDAETALRGFLIKMHEEAAAAGRPPL